MIRFEPITKRQQLLINIIGAMGQAGTSRLFKELQNEFEALSRITLIRDLNALVRKRILQRSGKGRSVTYQLAGGRLLRMFGKEEYFKEEQDQRMIQKNRLDFSDIQEWKLLFPEYELKKIDILTSQFQKRMHTYPASAIKKELERITIEFSWKSSHIEGNTYSLLDTERLIKEHEEAKGKTHEEAIMILNHKAALEYAWKYARDFQKISPRKIEDIHTLIVKNLGIEKGIRMRPVGIIGTAYKPYDNKYQIQEAIEELCHLINALKHPLMKALVMVTGLSYIQPFEDGNKRTSRLFGNALLMAHELCPLSYRSIDEVEYKKAVILFYEQHSAAFLKKLFVEQYKFAVDNYFL